MPLTTASRSVSLPGLPGQVRRCRAPCTKLLGPNYAHSRRSSWKVSRTQCEGESALGCTLPRRPISPAADGLATLSDRLALPATVHHLPTLLARLFRRTSPLDTPWFDLNAIPIRVSRATASRCSLYIQDLFLPACSLRFGDCHR